MLHIKIDSSRLRHDLRWRVDARLALGVCHRLLGANGVGKTTFLEELKLHWSDLCPSLHLGFCDQPPLAPFQELRVAQVMDILWEAAPARRQADSWRDLEWWQDPSVQPWLARRVGQLSGGENQWVKILLMRSLRSDVCLLDEPFQSLDRRRQVELWDILRREERTLLLVHHGTVDLPGVKNWELQASPGGLTLLEAP